MANKRVAARTLDFTNVKESSGINPKHKEEGEYLAKVTEVRDDPAKDGEAMWTWIIKPVDDASAAYPYYVKLVDNQLWKLRNLFIAAGLPLPKKAVKIDPNKVVGRTIGIVLEDDEYEGKMKSVISACLPKEELSDYEGADDVDDVEDDEEEEEAPVSRRTAARRKAKAAVEEEEDEDDEEEDEEPAPVKRGRGRPRKVVEPEEDEDDEEEEEPAPVKRGRGRPRKVAPVVEDDDEDDEEEEEPAPRKRRAPAAKAAPARRKRRAPADDDDDDLDLDL